MPIRHFNFPFARIHTFKVGAVVWHKWKGESYYLAFKSLSVPERGVQIPRGRLERHESLGQSVLRETFEETGVRCKIICPLTLVFFENSDDDYSNCQIYYIVRPLDKIDPTLRWLHIDGDDTHQELEVFSVPAYTKPDFLSRGQNEVIYTFQQWLKQHDPHRLDSNLEKQFSEEIER